jgi:hypothetical protein
MKKSFVLAALILGAAALAQGGSRLGEFTLQNPGGTLEATRDRRTGVVQGTLTGPKVSLRSAFLEMSARKIWARAAPRGESKVQQLTNATASGGVRIVRRDVKSGESDVVSCERAELKAGEAPRSGHIELFGRVTWKTFDKSQRLLQQLAGEGGSIDFDESGETIRLKNVDATVPPPGPKEKGRS